MSAKVEIIVEAVRALQGCKGTTLAVHVAQSFIDSNEFLEALELAVMSGEIIEVAYILPEMTYREKSFYLPKGTQIRTLELGDERGTENSVQVNSTQVKAI